MNPQPPMHTAPMPPAPPPGWWKRNWKWFVPVTLFCLLVFAAVVIGLIITLVMGSIKGSVPYTRAMAQAKADPVLIAELGTPIEDGWLVSGSIKTSGSSGTASFTIPISGPKKSGTLHVIALKSPFVTGSEDWKITLLEVEIDGQRRAIARSKDDAPEAGELSQSNANVPGIVRPYLPPPIRNVPEGPGTGSGIPGGVPGGVQDGPPPPPRSNTPPTISGGVLNGRAIHLPKPAYPPLAKAAKATGTVMVQVLVDENGKVISATAVSGHVLLRVAAAQAAREARFTPTKLSGQQVKVSGVISYNFTQ